MEYIAHISGERNQTCREHCRNAAVYASKALESIGLSNVSYLAGLLHDEGKFTADFTEYIKAATAGKNVHKGSIIHSFAGVNHIINSFHTNRGNKAKNGWTNLTAEVIATAIGSHHGLFDEYDENSESGLDYRISKQPEYDKTAKLNMNEDLISEGETKELFSLANKEIEGIAMKCFGICGGNQENFMFYLGLMQRMVDSAVMEGDRRDTAEFMSGASFDEMIHTDLNSIWQEALDNVEETLKNKPNITAIDKARQEMSDYCFDFADKPGGIYRLDLPTGAGKTLASLRYALKHADKYHKDRIIFAVPLLSILDQNAAVIREAVGRDDIILEHHSNVVLEPEDKEELQRRDILVGSWSSPIIVTTLVQLLNTFFEAKTTSVRRFQSLCNSIIVIDEVQTVPQKMISLFNLTLNFLFEICGATIILCSATQPLFEESCKNLRVSNENIIPREQYKKYKELFKRTKACYAGELSYGEIEELAKGYLEKYGSTLIVCNTKREALQLYTDLSEEAKCIHLSTSMCMVHRRETISDITEKLERGEPFICISTQLIEAGVDVSFGSVIRIAAGIDSIAQAAGRCNRHGEKEDKPPVSIAFLKGEKLKALKEIKEARDITGELIAEFRKKPEAFDYDLLSDKATEFYYKRFFKKINEAKGKADYSLNDGTGANLLDLLSRNIHYAPENDAAYTMRQAYKTAGSKFAVFDNDQISVIVPYDEKANEIIGQLMTDRGTYDLTCEKELIKKSKEYVVQLFDNTFKALVKADAIYTTKDKNYAILKSPFYSKETGVMDSSFSESVKVDGAVWSENDDNYLL